MPYALNKLRSGQLDALNTLLARLGNNDTHTAILLPTRYGKSHLQRITALIALERKLISCAVSLSPNVYLRNQMIDNEKWAEFGRLFNVRKLPKYASITTTVADPIVNGERFLSVTTPFLQQNIDYWIDFAKEQLRLTKLPVLFFVDECRSHSTRNQWGRAITDIHRAIPIRVALLTAVAEREPDDPRVLGFEYEEREQQSTIVNKVYQTEDQEIIRVDKYSATKKTIAIKAHSTTTFTEAWQQNVLCHLERPTVDVDLSVIFPGEPQQQKMLSQIKNEKDLRRAIAASIRHPKVIRQVAKMFVERLGFFRALDQTCAGIVFCGNDEDDDVNQVNQHAKDIRQAILYYNSALKVHIATSAEESEGVALIERFAAGGGDVLIVKQMASLGLDIGRLKVGADLSPTRTKSAVVQRMMRIATPYGAIKCASWITLADELHEEIFASVVVKAGGSTAITSLEDLIASYEKEKGEAPLRPTFAVKDAVASEATDTKGNKATTDEVEAVVRGVFRIVPEIGALFTVPEIAERLRKEKTTYASATSTNDDIQDLRDDINTHARAWVTARCKPYSQDRFGELSQQVWVKVYQTVGVKAGTKLEKINDLAILKRILAAFQAL